MAKLIEEATEPKELESKRMKRQKALKDPRIGVVYPNFLQEGTEKEEQAVASRSRGAFKPAWGVGVEDSVAGNTKLAQGWSRCSIPPLDYRDFIQRGNIEASDSLGSEALAVVCLFSLLFNLSFYLHSSFN